MTYAKVQQLIAQAKEEKWEELNLAGLKLEELPPEIGELTQLKRLVLGKLDEEKGELVGNRLTRLPDELWGLTNLEVLLIAYNKLTEIPDALAQLTNLTQLDLRGNQISQIPDALAQLTNLTVLILGGNQISEIPDALAQLTNLTILFLFNNQISEIPDALAQLTNLTILFLGGNQISEIPDALANLTNLTYLSLSGNQISQIPDALANLTNLTQLYLGGNQISQIPDALAQLTNLTQLNLSFNQISQIPDGLAQLTNLTVLYLINNQISEIPDAIAKLQQLETLDLKNNRLIQLPQAIKELKSLKNLDLRKNPLPIPPEILAYKSPDKKDWETPDAQPILDYYFGIRDPNETQTIYEAKLLLVGEGGSGKTSLANKLLNPDYQLKPETEDTSTEGIDILKWEFTTANGKQYRINIWDFGGQEIYHQTHQFFLTQRSLYLLVADSRKEDTDHYFWLEIIQLLSNNSPVLLIQNEKQDRTCNLNLNQLRGEFANLRDTFSLNLADNRGLIELQSELQHQLEKLIPNGIPFPNKWFAVRYTLENDRRNYIEYSEYQNICRRHGITNRQEMCQLSQFLHDLGICLHFQNDPILCHRLILKPNWGTTAVYKILDHKKVKENLGQFNDKDLADIWQADEYADMHHQLLQLMKEFKVCYEIPRRQGEYIAPHLLSPESPPYDWQSENNLILRYKYNGFMPKGILTRFIVEMHKEIENVSEPENALVWKTGVILKDNSARAEIIEYYHKREIIIRVTGNRPRDLMTIIDRKFMEIHDSFAGLKYDTLIPCNCISCKPSQNPFPFPLNRLYNCLDKNRFTIECHESGEDVNVRGLIDGVINEYSDYPEFSGDDGEGLGRKPARGYRDKYMRKLKTRDAPQNPTVNLSVNVPISNNNQPEQTMSNDKIWHGDRVEGSKIGSINSLQGSVGDIHGNNIVNNYNDTEKQSLAAAAKEIQDLIE